MRVEPIDDPRHPADSSVQGSTSRDISVLSRAQTRPPPTYQKPSAPGTRILAAHFHKFQNNVTNPTSLISPLTSAFGFSV